MHHCDPYQTPFIGLTGTDRTQYMLDRLMSSIIQQSQTLVNYDEV